MKKMGSSKTDELSDALHSTDLASTLRLSQQTSSILGRTSSTLFTSGPDNFQHFAAIDRHFLACVQSGDDESARACLDQLTERFGFHNARIMGLRGLYEEAIVEHTASLEKRLREYERIISEDPVNVVRTTRSQWHLQSWSWERMKR